MSRGDYLDQKMINLQMVLHLIIILSQFKSMYLFKKKQTKKHPLQLQLFKFKTSNCSLIIAYIPNQQTFDTPHYKNNMGIYEVPQ